MASNTDLAAEIQRDQQLLAYANECGHEMPLFEQRIEEKRAELERNTDRTKEAL